MAIVNNGVAYYLLSTNKLVQPALNTVNENRTGVSLFLSGTGNVYTDYHGTGSHFFGGGATGDIEGTANPGTADAIAGKTLYGFTF